MRFEKTHDPERGAGKRTLLQILDSNGKRFVLLGLSTTALFLPAILSGGYFALAGQPLLAAAVVTVTGPICMTAQCGLYDAVLRAFRGDIGFWWQTYKNALRRNWRACVVPGSLFGLLYGAALGMVARMYLTGAVGAGRIALAAAGILLLTGIATLVTAQLALIELPTAALFKNAWLLFVPYFPRVMLSSLLQCLLWGVIMFLLPFSIPFIPLAGSWMAALAALLPIYKKPLDQVFRIEERLEEKNSSEPRE